MPLGSMLKASGELHLDFNDTFLEQLSQLRQGARRYGLAKLSAQLSIIRRFSNERNTASPGTNKLSANDAARMFLLVVLPTRAVLPCGEAILFFSGAATQLFKSVRRIMTRIMTSTYIFSMRTGTPRDRRDVRSACEYHTPFFFLGIPAFSDPRISGPVFSDPHIRYLVRCARSPEPVVQHLVLPGRVA